MNQQLLTDQNRVVVVCLFGGEEGCIVLSVSNVHGWFCKCLNV